MLTEEQVSKIEDGLYGDGWRVDLCSDWRTLQAKVAALTKKLNDWPEICSERLMILGDAALHNESVFKSKIAALTQERDAARKALVDIIESSGQHWKMSNTNTQEQLNIAVPTCPICFQRHTWKHSDKEDIL